MGFWGFEPGPQVGRFRQNHRAMSFNFILPCLGSIVLVLWLSNRRTGVQIRVGADDKCIEVGLFRQSQVRLPFHQQNEVFLCR